MKAGLILPCLGVGRRCRVRRGRGPKPRPSPPGDEDYDVTAACINLLGRAVHRDAELIVTAFQAFAAGDLETVGGIPAEDIMWRVAGTSVLSGEYRGREAVYGPHRRSETATPSIRAITSRSDDAVIGQPVTGASSHFLAASVTETANSFLPTSIATTTVIDDTGHA
jgi:hypothetical protein